MISTDEYADIIEAKPNGDNTFHVKIRYGNKIYEFTNATINITNMCRGCNRIFFDEIPNYCPDCGTKVRTP